MNQLEIYRKRGYTADTVFEDGRYEDLKTRLLEVGGVAVAFINLDLNNRFERLMKEGRFFLVIEPIRGVHIDDIDGTTQKWCKLNEGYTHFSGFALFSDDVWRYWAWAGRRGYPTVTGIVDLDIVACYGIENFWGKNYSEYLQKSYKDYYFKENNIL